MVKKMQKLYGLVGNPIEHSKSPHMHNTCFQELGIAAFYHAFNVAPNQLQDAIKGMKALGLAGFNVTIPHKIECMNYLDEIDELALKIGAVNTVANKNGKLVGYNTDGLGFVKSLKELTNDSLDNKQILLIGAGGAARSIYMSLASYGVKQVDICNRTVSRAEDIIKDCTYSVSSKVKSLDEAEILLGEYDIIVNTTSIGMYPHINEMPISIEQLRKNTIVSDIIYNPLETKLLKEAKTRGAITQNGLGMFVYQGALAFEIWEGKLPNIERMKQVVLHTLGG